MGLLSNRTIDAMFSDDRVYRYLWVCYWDKNLPRLCVVMCNPSNANEKYPDKTTTRVCAFARANGYGGVEVVNLFALVSTDPDALLQHSDPAGHGNIKCIEDTARACGAVLCAWGAHSLVESRSKTILEMLRRIKGVKLYHLGLTKDGHPKHPLYLSNDTFLTEWTHHHEYHSPR